MQGGPKALILKIEGEPPFSFLSAASSSLTLLRAYPQGRGASRLEVNDQ